MSIENDIKHNLRYFVLIQENRFCLAFTTCRQEDNFSSDAGVIGVPLMPGFTTMANLIRIIFGLYMGGVGHFFLSKGWLGQ